MSGTTVAERIREIVVEQLGVNPEQVTPEARFIEDLGADSLDTVELVMAFEEEFEAEIPDEDAEKILSVGDAIEYLQKPKSSDYSAADPYKNYLQLLGQYGMDRYTTWYKY